MGPLVKTLVILLLFAITIVSQTHPRLFYGPSDVATLQSRATTLGTPAYELWQMLQEMQADHFRSDNNKNSIITNPNQMPNMISDLTPKNQTIS